MDENDQDVKSPMKRVGSTRKVFLFNNIRQQLNEHLRCLDTRVESQVSLIQELQDLFRRRGELELEYSKSLDKLVRSLQARHKEQKQKREQWQLFSAFQCWSHLLEQTQSLSKDHATLAELYSVNIVSSLHTTIEDVQRIYKKCRAIGYDIHEEILRVLEELYATMKTYQKYETEWKAAEMKLMTAEAQQLKLEQNIHQKEKLRGSKKYRMIEKEVLKRRTKYTDARTKALKAKNEYELCLESSNTTIHKYFVDDLSDLIDCMDLGFSSMISRCLIMHVTADQGRARAILQQADGLAHAIHLLDSQQDKQKFLEHYHSAFMIPKRFEFQGQFQNNQHDLMEQNVQKELYVEMEHRLKMISQRICSLRTESEEIWKTLEMAEVKLLEHFSSKDCDISLAFTQNENNHHHHHSSRSGHGVAATSAGLNFSILTNNNNNHNHNHSNNSKLKADKEEVEDFYINKIREYIRGTSRIARLDAKAKYLRQILTQNNSIVFTREILEHPIISNKRKRIGRKNLTGRPKLFGGSLEEYLEITGEEIPLVMRSCIRVINLYGLHHQGIFRVSGSQVEISNFKEAFERGEDPLADTTDASDINSVAGVLKLYLRELRVPLFPKFYFESFIAIAEMNSKADMVKGIQQFLQNLPNSVVIVMRYLFAFLNHLSEYADENMMDAYNLAICFGPTLMPAPEDKDQVQYQNQINELIKSMIIYHEELFPKELNGLEYEKYISPHTLLDMDVGDSPSEALTEDPESDAYPSEDESDVLEAMAQFDFNARSSRELSLCKGDCIILRKQVSNDWWQGSLNGREGLVPDKYISLKLKDEVRPITQNSSSSIEHEGYGEKERSAATINNALANVAFNSIMLEANKNISKYVSDVYFASLQQQQEQHQKQQQQQQQQQQLQPSSQSAVAGESGMGMMVKGGVVGGVGGTLLQDNSVESVQERRGGGGVGGEAERQALVDWSKHEQSYILNHHQHHHRLYNPELQRQQEVEEEEDKDKEQELGQEEQGHEEGEAEQQEISQLVEIKPRTINPYHDEPHSFESAIEFQSAYDEQIEKFETTV